ncbi:canalicular multispecific organic anion transporter 1, partial [Galendromus occidentalis]|uniref:Canalicular multispecific organic anion transporter 1 n=1 Tax=Galendromus occidentalis TaxID=34638 RepID=A0AAJ6QNH4_9ACAR
VDPSIMKEELKADEDISFRNASFTWGDDENPVLKNLNFSIKKGELVAVVGSVAAGKSSLIQAIIGELIPTSGSVSRRKERKIGYVPQQAWILNSTVRKNILFGCAYAARRYRDIVKECCLLPDLKILQAGDSTEIGEKGVNLSGGQKQRVSLARAVYLDADIYLLDDPLSAVDAHVAYDLFNDVVGPKGILSGKTRILVTHSVAVLPHVDRIIVLEDGEVTHRGTYDEIMSQNVRLKELVETHANTGSENSVHDEVSRGSDEPSTRFRKRTRSVDSVSSNVSGCVERQMPDIPFGKLIEEEEMEVGVVRWRVYFEFLWHFGIIGTILGLTCYALSKAADLWSLLYITTYSKEIEIKNGTTPEDMWSHMQIYIAIGSSQGVAMLAALTVLSLGCIWTSTSLHNKMLDAVMKAPMSFFDATPTGRILNRFSRDVDELDVSLYMNGDGFITTWTVLLVTLIYICIHLPYVLIFLIPLFAFFLGIQRFYVASSGQIKRLNAVTKSPVLNCFNESIAGTTSIRAYNVQNSFISKHMRLLDNNQNCLFHEFNGYRWLAIRLNVVGSFIDVAVCGMLIYFRGSMPTEIASLLFTCSLRASDAFAWIVRMGAQVENSLVSAERVMDYTKTKPEAPWYLDREPEPEWPSEGQVRFENYSTRYKENLDLVLKKINLEILSGEKVGIVGRTGAGKSSLTLALLRILEAVEGKITIDGTDISELGLNALRSRLAIIPQDPVLFGGTLRENVDPEERYSDEALWAALEKAHLKSAAKPLSHKIEEGGSNLSVGERQLVCLARALLRNSKILILDEATAAVDLETDALIQKTIRHDFGGSTVITIAHRLHTIMDYDKIVVLDQGEIREVGSPRELLQDPDGVFSSMARDANIRIDS